MGKHSDGNKAIKKARVITEIAASYCEKSKPTEKTREYFKRKAYDHVEHSKRAE